MAKTLEENIRSRANNLCEYCLVPQRASKLTFHIEHIISRKHGGQTTLENLALACGRCNRSKGPNISGLDPETREMSRLFNPRTDQWDQHFRYDGTVIVGLSIMGRTTIGVLAMNNPYQMAARQALIDEGAFPIAMRK